MGRKINLYMGVLLVALAVMRYFGLFSFFGLTERFLLIMISAVGFFLIFKGIK